MNIPQAILNIAEICAGHKVSKLVLSPGSRNAPLLLSLTRHPAIDTRIISDERSAAYVALGIAQQQNKPVILLCTSGSAALNYGPAIAEAFYQNIPLLVITADRPPEWIDQKDGQTVRQFKIFDNHVKKSFELPVAMDHKDAQWQVYRIINEAIITTTMEIPGPVHVNVPLREPLYPLAGDPWTYDENTPVIKRLEPSPGLNQKYWDQLTSQWNAASKILIVGGQAEPSEMLLNSLGDFQEHTKTPVIGDVVSNLHAVKGTIRHAEIILRPGRTKLRELQPDLLISFGGSVISKSLKLFLRSFPPRKHWHLQPSGFAADPFQNLTDIIPLSAPVFFSELQTRLPEAEASGWYHLWQKEESSIGTFLEKFLDQQAFNEMQAVRQVLKSMPVCKLHLANSMPVRWCDFLGVAPETFEICSNRGASGIDGSNSTALGHAMYSESLNVLLTGDMAFFYDRNAFWHSYKVPNLKVIILNNHGGGIFKLIDGPSEQPELAELFVTNQKSTAEYCAREFGLKYLYCKEPEKLDDLLLKLWEPSDRTCILEIEVPDNMQGIYQEFKEAIKKL